MDHSDLHSEQNRPAVPAISLQELVLLKRMLLFTQEDEKLLHIAAPILKSSLGVILQRWYNYIRTDSYLSSYFDISSEAAFRNSHFSTWLQQLCSRPDSQNWQEVERKADESVVTLHSLQPELLRYLVIMGYPVIRFGTEAIAISNLDPVLVGRIGAAWYKAVTLSLALWAYPSSSAK